MLGTNAAMSMKQHLIILLTALTPLASADISLGSAPAPQAPAISAEAEPYVSMAQEVLGVVKELTGILETVTDTASADAAAAQVENITGRMLSLQAQAEAMPRPQAAIEQQVRSSINVQEVQQIVSSFMNSFIRIGMNNGYGSQALLNALGPVLNAMPGKDE